VLLQAVSLGIMKPTNPTPRRLVRSLPLHRSESDGSFWSGRLPYGRSEKCLRIFDRLPDARRVNPSCWPQARARRAATGRAAAELWGALSLLCASSDGRNRLSANLGYFDPRWTSSVASECPGSKHKRRNPMTLYSHDITQQRRS
jgi:hypothetical protein